MSRMITILTVPSCSFQQSKRFAHEREKILPYLQIDDILSTLLFSRHGKVSKVDIDSVSCRIYALLTKLRRGMISCDDEAIEH
jgi:hypothetical protein